MVLMIEIPGSHGRLPCNYVGIWCIIGEKWCSKRLQWILHTLGQNSLCFKVFFFRMLFWKLWKYTKKVHGRLVAQGFSASCNVMAWNLMPFLINPRVVFFLFCISLSPFKVCFTPFHLPYPFFLALPLLGLPLTSRCLHKPCSYRGWL